MTATELAAPVGTDADGRYLVELLGVPFTDPQLRVATHPLAPQLVVAGAGSGKTMVMAARVVHAVAHFGVLPGEILGLTFTTKAAGELADRVRRALQKLASRGLLTAPAVDELLADDLPTISTYNAYAAGLVRDHALRIGREPVSQLVTEASAFQLAASVVRAAPGPFPALGIQPPAMARRVLGLAGEMADHLVDVAEVRAENDWLRDRLAETHGDTPPVDVRDVAVGVAKRAELLGLVERYQQRKADLELVDYGDQIALAARIARSSDEVGRIERSRFRLVVLDEYQDTGVGQAVLLSTLFRDHAVTAVGDPHQAIYGWRGASVANLRNVGVHFTGEPVEAMPLMTSFRNGGRILAGANALAEPLRAEEAGAGLAVEPLLPQPGRADDGEICVARLSTDQEEAEFIAADVDSAIAAGTAPGEVAILVRRRSDITRIHHALLARGIRVEVVGLGGLVEAPEVVDVLSVLRLLVDPADNAAMVRVLTGPRWRIGVRDLAALGRRAGVLAMERYHAEPDTAAARLRAAAEATDRVEATAIIDAIEDLGEFAHYSPEALERLAAVRAELDTLRRLVGQPLVDVITEVVRRTGLDAEIEAAPVDRATAGAASLAAFLDEAARYVGLAGETDLLSFLDYLDAAAAEEDGLEAAGAVSTQDTVKIMTIHKAKGLEWDLVYVPGLVDGTFPSKRGRSTWIKGGECVPNRCRGDNTPAQVLHDLSRESVKAVAAALKADALPEERRLAYVAVTRARKRCVATAYCWSRTRMEPVQPSEYVLELRDVPDVVTAQWCEDVDPATGNPMQDDAVPVPWPRLADDERSAARRSAAEQVRREIASGGTVPAASACPDDRAAEWAVEVDLVLSELRAQRQAQLEVPLPARLSATQLVALAADPDGLAASLARPMPSRPAPKARRGSRFHLWVEQYYGAPLLLGDDELPGSQDADLDEDDLAVFQASFRAGGWADRVPVDGGIEAPFELSIEGRLLRGRIDAVFREPDGSFLVVDWKTGAVPADTQAAALQLAVYRCAWAELHDVDESQVGAAFVYLKTGQVLRPDRLPGRAELAALLRDDPVDTLF